MNRLVVQFKATLTFEASGINYLAVTSNKTTTISRDDVVAVEFTPINRAHQLRFFLKDRKCKYFLGFKRAVRFRSECFMCVCVSLCRMAHSGGPAT